MILVGDLGGTKIVLALLDRASTARSLVAVREFASAQYPSLDAVVRDYLATVPCTIERVCLAVAGPVLNGRAEGTNLPWVVEEEALAREIGVPAVTLMNDLVATARAVPLLGASDLRTINDVAPERGGTIGVLAPGTGLGEAYLTWDGSGYRAHASEGGHGDFAPTTERQMALLRYLWQRFDHVSYERVCSGIGIPHLYDFLREAGPVPASSTLTARLATAGDRTRVIVAAACYPVAPDPLSVATLELFAEILGAEVGNLALRLLATGGIYLAGGLAEHAVPFIASASFARAFRHKGRFAELLDRVPVHIMRGPSALLGAAAHALDLSARRDIALAATAEVS